MVFRWWGCVLYAIAFSSIFSLLQEGNAYKDPEVNHEELMTKKNAPRWIKMLVTYGHLTKIATNIQK